MLKHREIQGRPRGPRARLRSALLVALLAACNRGPGHAAAPSTVPPALAATAALPLRADYRIRIDAELQPDFSAGILEWRVGD